LLLAAVEVFAREGFAGAAVDEIAEHAGYSRGAFYANFQSKDDLFLATLEMQMEAVIAAAKDIVDSATEPAAKIALLKQVYIEEAHNKNLFLLFTEFFLFAIRNHGMRDRFNRLNQRYMETIATILKTAIPELQQGHMAKNASFSLLSLGHGLALQHFSNPKYLTREESNGIMESAFGIFVEGDRDHRLFR
jgi:AcrR family transcriptional regulator